MTLVIEQEFLCRECGRIDTYPPHATPIHCSEPMSPSMARARMSDPETTSVALVAYQRGRMNRDLAEHLRQPNRVGGLIDDFQGDEWEPPLRWDPCFEVWILRPGRHTGERMSWLGAIDYGWEFHLVKGMPGLRDGFALTKELAVVKILYAFAK